MINPLTTKEIRAGIKLRANSSYLDVLMIDKQLKTELIEELKKAVEETGQSLFVFDTFSTKYIHEYFYFNGDTFKRGEPHPLQCFCLLDLTSSAVEEISEAARFFQFNRDTISERKLKLLILLSPKGFQLFSEDAPDFMSFNLVPYFISMENEK